MQETRKLVTEKSESCRKNFKITCFTDHFSLCFWSGDKRNEFVVQRSAGKCHAHIVSLSFSEWIKGAFKRYWQKFAGVTLVAVGAAVAIFGGPVGAVVGPALTYAAGGLIKNNWRAIS